MLEALFAAALFGAPAAALQAHISHSETLFCTRELRRGDPRAWGVAQIETDRRHRPLRRTLLVFRREYRAAWVYPTERFDSARTLRSWKSERSSCREGRRFRFGPRSGSTARPSWEREFARPTDTVLVVPASPLPTGVVPPFLPGVTIRVGDGELPSLFAVSRADVVITSIGGSEVTTRDLPMLDWANLQIQAAEAFASLEGERRRGQCRPNEIVTAH